MSRRSRMDGAAWLAKRRKHTAPKVCRHDGVHYVSAFETFLRQVLKEHCPACGVRTCRVMRPEGIRTEELRIVAPEEET